MSGCSVKTIHHNWLSIIAPFDAVSDSDGQLAIQKYIDQSRMSLDGWGGDKEIRAYATMFQVDICVSNNSRGGIITHHSVMMKRTAGGIQKLYLYHSDTETQYDLVIPGTLHI